MTYKLVLILLLCIVCSCGGNQTDLAFYDSEEEEILEADDYYSTIPSAGTDAIEIPFRESNGVKLVQVSINGLICEMIFDTGCSSTLISVAEANYLYQKGRLTEDDIIGISESMIADGSIVENMEINLKEVIVGGKILCENVVATVSDNAQAPLLLGNEILDRASSYSVDNERMLLIFNIE